MRSIRKLALAGVAALMLCALVAASASAAIVTFDAGGTALATGATFNIASTGGSTLTGSFFGFGATTITCSGFQAVGAVQHNPGASATITSAKFTGCHNQNNVTCTSGTGAAAGELVANNTTWTPGASGAGGGGLVASSTTAVFIGTGTNGSFTIPSACKGNTGDCNVFASGAQQGDGAGDHFISNTAQASWTNTPPQATITNQGVSGASSCLTGGTWSTAASNVRTGSTVGSGTFLTLM